MTRTPFLEDDPQPIPRRQRPRQMMDRPGRTGILHVPFEDYDQPIESLDFGRCVRSMFVFTMHLPSGCLTCCRRPVSRRKF